MEHWKSSWVFSKNIFFILMPFYSFEAYGQGKRKSGLKLVGFFRKMVVSSVKKVTISGRICFNVCVCVCARARMCVCACACVHACNTHVLYLAELEKWHLFSWKGNKWFQQRWKNDGNIMTDLITIKFISFPNPEKH